MCGIIGYIGKRNAPDIVIDALRKAETRGYDGFGIAVPQNGTFEIRKKGGVDCLDGFLKLLQEKPVPKASYALGHNRWATHGDPADRNSHPHVSALGKLFITHNGIIENYDVLKATIEQETQQSLQLQSDTDTEVLVYWIEHIQRKMNCKLKQAVRAALKHVQGTFAFIVMSIDEPGVFVGAVRGRTMRIGVGEHEGSKEFFIASEVYPFMQYTQTYVVIESHKIITVNKNGYTVEDARTGVKEYPELKQLESTLYSVEKGEYKYWMEKEINEQPKMIGNVLQGRVRHADMSVVLGGIKKYENDLKEAIHITVLAHGTSFNAALLFKYWCEALTGIAVNTEIASEFHYRKSTIGKGSIVIGISQSGETADTIGALEHAQKLGATILGICNVEGSHIAEITEEGIYLRAGRELGVASTKAFSAQMAVGMMLSLHLARIRGTLTPSLYIKMFEELQSLPLYIEETLRLMTDDVLQPALDILLQSNSVYYIGRGYSYPIALEGALKIKEIAGIHAEGYPASEMKHGPIGLLNEQMPVVALATASDQFEKTVTSIKEAQARKSKVIALITQGTKDRIPADVYIELPKVGEEFSPFITVLPLQILAFKLALLKGKNPDKPEGLAKSVTVE